MVIGLDGMPLAELKTGVGHYTAELSRALALIDPAADFQLITPSNHPIVFHDDNASFPANLKISTVPVGAISQHWWSVGLPLYLRRQKLNLFHGTNYDVPLWGNCTTVLTIHDLSQLLYPDTHKRRVVQRARRRLPLMSRTAKAVIVPTGAIKAEVIERLRISSNKITVVPEAARSCFKPLPLQQTTEVRQRLGIDGPFLLAVGTIEPRKNYPMLINAFNEVTKVHPELNVKLVIVGERGWLSDSTFDTLENSIARDRVMLTGYLGDDDLRALYSSCEAFIYPSVYEGFGLPPLEAMSCGAPVIASNAPAVAEVTGGAAHLFSALSKEEFGRAILDVLKSTNLRRALIEKGLKRASDFSWEHTARETLAVYREAKARSQT